MTPLQRRLAVARGDEPADLVVRGGRVLSVFTREWLEVDVAIVDGVIAGLGSYEGRETVDAAGRYVVPGFIDAHMHLESVKLLVDELARLVLPLGTTAVVADPHEIANVLGSDGVHWLHDASADLQLEVFFMAPSSVPASAFESPRRPLALGDLEALMRRRRVLGLAEMMNFPGVIAGEPSRARKARARRGRARRRPRARGARQAPAGLRGGGDPLRPRGADRGGGAGAVAGRDVAADPRGLDGAQPAGAPSARGRLRTGPDRVLHRRPRSRRHRRQRPRQRDGARRGRRGRRSGGCAPDGDAASRRMPPAPQARCPRAGVRRRPARAPRPRAFRPRRRAEARASRSPRSRRRTSPSGSGRPSESRRSPRPTSRLPRAVRRSGRSGWSRTRS